MKLYQSNQRILAARITAIILIEAAKDTTAEPMIALRTDQETVQVPREWAARFNPQIDGYVLIDPVSGIAGYLGAEAFLSSYAHIGEVSLEAKAAAPKTYTFDEFVQYGRDNGGNIVDGMPWSFSFHGHPVTHEHDRFYVVGANPQLHFTASDEITVEADGSLSISGSTGEPVDEAAQ